MRFIILGIVLIFVGFIILGAFGHEYHAATFASDAYRTCYEYYEAKPPSKINCSFKIMDQTVFFALILSFVISGIISLIKGTRGDWDNKVKPEDMTGPSK